MTVAGLRDSLRIALSSLIVAIGVSALNAEKSANRQIPGTQRGTGITNTSTNIWTGNQHRPEHDVKLLIFFFPFSIFIESGFYFTFKE